MSATCSVTMRADARVCSHPGCSARLSRFNRGRLCSLHDHVEYHEVTFERVTYHQHEGAHPDDVRQLVTEQMGDLDVGVFAERIGLNVRTLRTILTGRNRNGRPSTLVARDIVDRLLIGLGFEHERCRWGCLAGTA